MDHTHDILKKQLKEFFGGENSVPGEFRGFIKAVNDAYRSFDEDRVTLDRSLELISDEMLRSNWKLMNIGERLRLQNEMLLRLARNRTMETEGREKALSEVAEVAYTALRSDRSCIWFLNDDGTELSCAGWHSGKNEHPPANATLSSAEHPGFFKALEEQRIIAVPNVDDDERTEGLSASMSEFPDLRSLLGAPIRLGGTTVGIVMNLWKEEIKLWHPEEQQFNASLADFVSMSLEHWHLKQAEKGLLAMKEQELGLLRAIPHGVLGLHDRKIIFANESVRAVFGWSPEEIIGRSARILYRNDDDYAAVGTIFYTALETKPSHTDEFPCVRRDGTVFTCRISAARIGDRLTEHRIVAMFEDITSSIRYSRELKTQKKFTENLLQNLEVPLFAIDTNHNVIIWNTACEHMTGLSADEILGTDQHWKAFYSGKRFTLADLVIDRRYDEIPKNYTVSSKSLFVEDSWHGENWFENIGGRRRYMIFDAVPIYDDTGMLVAAIETLQDITKQKEAEEALGRSENTYRAIFESTGTAMLMIEQDTTVSLTNSEFQRATGYSRAQIDGKMSWTSFVDPDDLERMKKYHAGRRIDPSSAPRAYEFRLKNRDGGIREMFLTITMIPDTGKSIASLMDITQLKTAEREIVGMRFFLQSIIDSMPSIIIGVDRTGAVTQWNRAAREETGLTVERVLGVHLTDALPWLANQEELLSKSMNEKRPQKCERLMQNFGEIMKYIDIMVYPLVREGVEGAVLRIDDVTERVRIDEMIIQTEKMVSVGGLAAGMAHEINNPLSGIMLGAENIHRRITQGLKKNDEIAESCGITMEKLIEYHEKREVFKMLDSIREMGMRAASIVSNMLSFSRMSPSRMILVNLAEVAEKTMFLAAHDYDLKKQYDFRHIKIVQEFDDDLPEIPCNPTEIEQVLLNLLRNAAQEMARKDYSRQDPVIRLRMRNTGDTVTIEVEDNGPGMDEAVRKRVFEPFYTTKEPGAGTGLGLSVSYFIITNNHGGAMAVESEPGKGAKFTIQLPVRRSGP